MELAVSFGRELQLERERRDISLESISESTKVPSRHLQALENGELARLPGGVFNKGILRSYCRYLGLSEEDWVNRFVASTGVAREPEAADLAEFAENLARSRGRSRSSNSMRWWGVLLMLLALGAMCWGAWKFVLRPQVVALPMAQEFHRMDERVDERQVDKRRVDERMDAVISADRPQVVVCVGLVETGATA